MSILKIEAFAGMSGDMFLGALADLAGAYEELKSLPSLLGLESEAEVQIRETVKTGIACKHVRIIDKNNPDTPPDSAMDHHHEHKHHHKHEHKHTHSHPHPHSHTTSHSHTHSHPHSHTHSHRHLSDINQLIDAGQLPERTKRIAKAIFLELGRAESEVHGIPLQTIHFHEVGAIDSIMDIVGAAWLIDRLDIHKVYCTPVTTGFGFAMTEHGKLPIPCPATQKLLLGVPIRPGDNEGELTTPTGAAILRYLDPQFTLPVLREEKIGYGPGEKDLEIPNVLRLSLCRAAEDAKTQVMVLETHMDDVAGEWLGDKFQAGLLENGAIDFFMQQVIMKKGRPGTLLTVLCRPDAQENLANWILMNTPTIGLRYYRAERTELAREEQTLDLPEGKVRLKVVTLPDGSKRMKPEFEDLHKLAGTSGRPIKEMANVIQQAWDAGR